MVRHRDARLNLNDRVEFVAELCTETGNKSLRIPARVVWVKNDWLGAEFSKPAQSLVTLLHQHDQLRRRASAGNRTDSPAGEDRIVARLRHAAKGALPGLLDELLIQVGSGILDRADGASSNREQQQLLEDMTALDAIRREGGADLTRYLLKKALSVGCPANPHAPPTTADGELALMDTDEFERWLESTSVATRLHDMFRSELRELGSCGMGRLSGGRPTSTDVPFNPHHFTSVLNELAARLGLSAPSRKVLFGVAERLLAQRLGGFYHELRDMLASLGAGAVPAGTGRKDTELPPQSTGVASKPVREQNPADKGSAPAGPVTVSAGVAVEPGIQAQRQALAQELMQHITEASGASGSLADWLQHLQEPLLHEATSNQGFFHDTGNPLRSLIDHLGHLQMFRPHAEPPGNKDPVQRTVAELLHKASRQTDEAGYVKVADQIGRLVDNESLKYQRNVERVVAADIGRDRIRRARQQVVAELNRRYADRQVPPIVPDLLDAGWRAVLELTLLRSGGDGVELSRRFDLLDALVALLGGEAYAKHSPAASPREVLERFHQELASGSFDPLRRRQIETRLRADLLDHKGARHDLVRMARLDAEDDAAGGSTPPEGIAAEAWERLQDRAAAFAVGDRVWLLDAPEGQQELRIAWIRDDRQRYSLVDHRGLRAKVLAMAELAQGLHTHLIRHEHADGRTLSERAAESMLEQMEKRLAYQAAHDSLTGLLNRVQFYATLQQRLAERRTAASPGALLLIDVDQFHLISNLLGYDAGDRLLIALARLLEERCGADSVLGHLGGDRFAVIEPVADLIEGERRAIAACASIAEIPMDRHSRRRTVTASIGVVGLSDVSGGSGQALQAAEAAVAVAKAAGGNRAYCYRQDDLEIKRRQESVQWIARVDEALDCGRLRLRCQPIVPALPRADLVSHYEVLLGVENEQGRSLSISEFITAAESYKRMAAVDRWVTRTTVEWVAAHHDRMPELHGFAVNLSGQTVGDPGFVDFLRELFRCTRIAPEWISFEVTETSVIANLAHTAGIIREIKALGCAVALDDFGSGLASYSYLKELPVDWLKIDGVFVRNIANDANDLAVVRSINEIGHFMGKQTIAEYVVDERVLAKIRSLGVDFVQGFGIAPPCLLDDLLKPNGVAASAGGMRR